jgi:hypothetical protein
MDSIEKQFVGKITSGLDPNTLPQKTIDFVYTQLSAWRDDPNRPGEQSENRLNLQLCKFLNTTRIRNAFPMVHFEHEEYEVSHRSVDISASPNDTTIIGAKTYSPYDPIVILEGKRLPAPSNEREKEYVTGGKGNTGGGIQRFKLGVHGPNHDIVAMIGYLQDGSATIWYNSINKWITELSNGTIADVCAWNNSEMLETLEEDDLNHTAKCQSTHVRSGSAKSNKILICHLWVTMHT